MRMKLWRLIVFLLLSSFLHAQQPVAVATLATDMVVTQESTVFQITIEGADIYGWPQIPPAPPLTFKQGQIGISIINGRRTRSLSFAVYSYRAGVFKIPSIKLQTTNGELTTEPLTLRVFDQNLLKEGVAEVAGNQLPYFSGIFMSKDNPYVGEEQPVMLKLFISQNIRISEPQLAEMETQNLAAWRFENRSQQGYLERNGEHFQSLTYVSTVSALKEGKATLGPGKVEPLIQGQTRQRGFTRWHSFNSRFDFPKIEMTIRPLPEPKPEGFDGAVGNFKITSLPATEKIELGENLTVDLAVTGSGNLDNLTAPRLQGKESEWKRFEAIRMTQGTERRQANGTVNFNQVLRPLKILDELPPYKLVFFDPLTEEYRTTMSSAYPLIITGNALAEDSTPIPLVNLTSGTMKTISRIPLWIWQLIPALLTLIAVAVWIIRKIKSRKMAGIPQREFENDLAQLKKTSAAGRPEFFRALGRFLERWPHDQIQEEVEQWLLTRDEICFAPKKQDEKILPKERSQILKTLKRCAPLIVLFFAFIPTPAEATLEQLWENEEYQTGADHLRKQIAEKPTPGAYYNLGLFEEKLEHPATALLCYYRALASDSSLDPQPAIQLATKTGALMRLERNDDDWLALAPRSAYREIFFFGLWLLVLAYVLRILIASPKWKTRITIFCLLGAPVALLTGGLAWWFYPKEISYRPLLEGSVVMKDQALRNSPHNKGESFRELPAGSIGYVTAERGNWSYVEFARDFRGWLPKDSLRAVADPEL